MRPQQQNRRMRGRNNNNNGGGNNNNRKGPNPLNRNYESNGPDVKIRGSAQQIAEKYATLARDAMSSGDRVMAENYLQHAEHYNRIIAAAQAQMPIQHVQPNRDEFDDDIDGEREDFESGAAVGEVQVPAINHGAGPQPVIEGMPAEVALNSDGGRENNGSGRNRDRRHQNGRRNEFGQGAQREEQQSRSEQDAPVRKPEPEQDVPSAPEASAAEPAPQTEHASPTGLAAQVEQNEKAADEAAPRRARRPRKPRASPGAGAGEEAAANDGEAAASAES